MLGFGPLGALAIGQLPGSVQEIFGSFIDPVYQKIKPQLAVALIASGLFAPILIPSQEPEQVTESRWHQPWSEPVRLRPGLRASLQQYVPSQGMQNPGPANTLQGWYNWLGEPVRLKLGLKTYFQQTLAYHPRILPKPSVTLVMNARETNNDIALFGLVVYNQADKAIVSIREIPATNAGAASIEET